jgi:DNA-nicking Smr family endonuclease
MNNSDENKEEQHTETRKSKVHPSTLKKMKKSVILPVDADVDLKRMTISYHQTDERTKN